MRSLARIVVASLVTLALASAFVPTAARAETVDLLRDDHGVVHVFAATDLGAHYGAGYAAARDRLYQMHRTRRTVQGRLAELEGLRGLHGGSTTVDSDKRWRRLRGYVHCTTVAAALDAPTRAALQAYADGVNLWIAQSAAAGTQSPLFHGDVPEPWTMADCLAVWNRIGDWFGSDVQANESKTLHDLEAVGGDCAAYHAVHPTDAVLDEASAMMQLAEVPPATLAGICAYAASMGYPCDFATGGGSSSPRLVGEDVDGPKFSHAWVVGGSALDGGSTALVSDPQTQVTSPSIWYEMHVKGATFDARGLSFAGCPGFLIGFSRDMAWGATSLGIDLSDTYRLTPTAGGTQYVFDGGTHPIFAATDTILVRQPGGGFTSQTFAHRWTALGPIVTELMSNVFAGEEYVVRNLPLVDQDRHTVQAALAMMAAPNFDAFKAALIDWRAPSLHLVSGDRFGKLGYWTMGAIPVRPSAYCLAGRASIPLADSSGLWQDTLPIDVRPHVIKPGGGTLYSANHMAVGAWYPIPLLLSTGGSGHGDRGWRLDERLVVDGPPVFSEAEVLDVHYDDVHPARREIVRAGLHLRDEAHVPPVALSASALSALGALDGWYGAGAHGQLAEANYAAAWWINLYFRADKWPVLVPLWGGNNLAHFLKDVKARLDAHTPAMPAAFTPAEIDYFDRSLAAAWDSASAKYGPPPLWQAAMQAAYGTKTLPYFQTIEGWGTLDPLHDVTVSGLTVPDAGTIRSQYGQSMTLFATLARPDRSRAIQPIGKSEDPASPFFTQEQAGWVNGTLRPAPLSRAVVETMLDSSTPLSYSSTVGVPEGGAGPWAGRVALAPGHPARGGVVLTVELPRAEALALEVFDAGGRRLARRVDPAQPVGTHRVAWSPAGGVAAGVYFVRVRGTGWARDVKAVVLP